MATENARRASYYTCSGPVRGDCGRYSTCQAAERFRQGDADGCASQGGYSDLAVYAVMPNGDRLAVVEVVEDDRACCDWIVLEDGSRCYDRAEAPVNA